jgi:hypothetical protein
MDSPIDPMWAVMNEGGPFHAKDQLAEYCRNLENSDREWAIEELRNHHPGEF